MTPTFEVFGPNASGGYTVMSFTDHYDVHSRHFSREAAEAAKARAEAFHNA